MISSIAAAAEGAAAASGSSNIVSSSSSHQRGETASTKTKLTCHAILSPPPLVLGQGDDRIVYTVRQPAWQCCFSLDGIYLAVCYGAPHPCIRIWRQRQRPPQHPPRLDDENSMPPQEWILEATLTGIHERTIRSVAFAPVVSPRILASASFDSTIVIWEQQREQGPEQQPEKEWECVAQLEGHDNEAKCVRWNATGSLLATCGRDKTVWVWECFLPGTVGGPTSGGDYECIAVLNGHDADVKCVQFAPSHGEWGDGQEIILSCSYDETIKCWAEDGGDWYCAASISGVHSSTIWSITLSPSGGRLVSASSDGSLAIYKCYTASEKKSMFDDEKQDNTAVWKCVGTLPDAHSSTIFSVDYAPARAGHGRIVSGGGDNRIQVYREAMGSSSDQPLFALDASASTDDGDVNHVCWHPLDGSLLASAGDDGIVRLWTYGA